MGIFSRRRSAVADHAAAAWESVSDDIEICPAYLMEDEAAGDHAFGARFRPECGCDASLTIWAFPAPCGPTEPAYYFVGYKTEYEWHGATDGSTALYHGDLACARWYGDLAEATEAARTAATALAMAGPGAASQHVPAETIAEWFDWDGAPW